MEELAIALPPFCSAFASVPGNLFLIHPQRVLQLLQQLGHGSGTDPDIQPRQFVGNLLGGFARPLQPTDGITRRFQLHQRVDAFNDLRSFF